MLSFLVATFLIGSLSATSLFFVNNSHEASSSIHEYVVSFDVNAKKTVAWSTSIPSADIIASGGIVCNYSDGSAIYYGVWVAALSGPGVFSFDINAGKLLSYTEVDNGNYNYHVFQCTDTKNVLLAVSNDFQNPINWYLDQLTLSGSNSTTRKNIAHFNPKVADDFGNYDTIFSFNPSTNELWISWANSATKPTSGTLQIINTETGAIKSSYTYPRGYGEPYFTIPQTLQNKQFKGAVIIKEIVYFVTLEISGTELKQINSDKAEFMWSSSQPSIICNGTGYSLGDQGAIVTSWNIQTGKQIEEINLVTYVQKPLLGDMACV
eukprot:293199_1